MKYKVLLVEGNAILTYEGKVPYPLALIEVLI